MNIIKKILREEIEKLFEREMKNSVSVDKMIPLFKSCHFYPLKDGEHISKTLSLYYKNDNASFDNYNQELQKDFYKLEDIVKKSGWTINQYGTHYDGLRNWYQHFQNEHPEFTVGTFFVNIESEYGYTMEDMLNIDDTFGKNETEPYNEDYNHYGYQYEQGIFYHLTERKNLKSIMAHGLRPKNGGGITNWRNSSPRIYLSLLPDFRNVDIYDEEDEDEEDTVMLRIDLRKYMKNFKLYVDEKYKNAVYTYECIPPQLIEVVDVNKEHSDYYVNYCIKQIMKNVIEYNFGDINSHSTKTDVRYYYSQILEMILSRANKMISRYNAKIPNNLKEIVSKLLRNYLDS